MKLQLSLVLLHGLVSSFPSDYQRIHGCKPPKIGDVYMGSPAVDLSLDRVSVKRVGPAKTSGEVVSGEIYDVDIQDNEKWTYIIDVSSGNFTESPTGSLECSRRRYISRGRKNAVSLKWLTGREMESVTFTVTRAKGYGALEIVEKSITLTNSDNKIKSNLNEQKPVKAEL